MTFLGIPTISTGSRYIPSKTPRIKFESKGSLVLNFLTASIDKKKTIHEWLRKAKKSQFKNLRISWQFQQFTTTTITLHRPIKAIKWKYRKNIKKHPISQNMKCDSDMIFFFKVKLPDYKNKSTTRCKGNKKSFRSRYGNRNQLAYPNEGPWEKYSDP